MFSYFTNPQVVVISSYIGKVAVKVFAAGNSNTFGKHLSYKDRYKTWVKKFLGSIKNQTQLNDYT